MRMRAYVEPAPCRQIDRADMVEEHERPDMPAQARGQYPAHGKTVAEIVQARFDQE